MNVGPARFALTFCWLVSASSLYGQDAAAPTVAPAPPEGFTALFNGTDLTGWRGMAHRSPYDVEKMSADERAKVQAAENDDLKRHWRVEQGELVNDGQGVFATTDKDYGDFELHLEYKTVPRADSGIYLRGTPQVQIWDPTENEKFNLGADKGSGGLWNNRGAGKFPSAKLDKPFGQWNAFRIKMVGDKVTVVFNEQTVVQDAPLDNYWDAAKPLPTRGPLQLQTHGGEIRWRNIYLKPLN